MAASYQVGATTKVNQGTLVTYIITFDSDATIEITSDPAHGKSSMAVPIGWMAFGDGVSTTLSINATPSDTGFVSYAFDVTASASNSGTFALTMLHTDPGRF